MNKMDKEIEDFYNEQFNKLNRCLTPSICMHLMNKYAEHKLNNHDFLADVSGSADYWSKRCELSEKIDDKNPCDPDITVEQIESYNDYHKFLDDNGQKDYR